MPEHSSKSLAVARIAGKLPRRSQLEIAICLDDEAERRSGRVVERKRSEAPLDAGARALRGLDQKPLGFCSGAELRNATLGVAHDQREHTPHEVSELIRKLGICRLDQARSRKVRVLVGVDVSQEKPAQGFGRDVVQKAHRIDGIAERLSDLVALDGEVAVDQHLARRCEPGREQDRRPVDGVKTEDALSDQVRAPFGRRPAPVEFASRLTESERR